MRGERWVRSPEGRIDVRSEDLTVRSRGHVGHADVRGIEGFLLPKGRWRFDGSRRAEVVSGGYGRSSRLVARMGGGNDRVHGTPGPDRLFGGRGYDKARPLGGRDVCGSIEKVLAYESCQVARRSD